MEVLEGVDYLFAGRGLENEINFHSLNKDLRESPLSWSNPNSSTPLVKRDANREAVDIEDLSVPI